MTIIVSKNNEGPTVNVAAWIGSTVMVLGVCTRMWSKYSVLQKWTVDDALIVVAMILGCTMTATLTMAVANGLGEPQSSLSDHHIMELQKYAYASQLLYIPALCLTKTTTLVYLRDLSPKKSFQLTNALLEVFITLWGLAIELAAAFECALPSPWAIITGKCFNQAMFWRVNGGIDILTEVIIVLLPFHLVWSLQMPRRRKGVVAMAFGSRVLIIPLTAWRIYSLNAIGSPDQTLSLYYVYLTTTIQLNFAIFMSCVTFLRPFLESMVSGGMAGTVQPTNSIYGKNSKLSTFFSTRSQRTVAKPSPTYNMDNLSEVALYETSASLGKSESNSNGSHTETPSLNNDEIQVVPAALNDLGPLRADKVTSVSRVSNPPVEENKEAAAGCREEMVITQTREWNVQAESKHGKGKRSKSKSK